MIAYPSVPSSERTFITLRGGTAVERDALNGGKTRTLARNVNGAAETADGTMFYVAGSTCQSTVTEVTRAGRKTRILALKNDVQDVSVSRDGAWIAYLTYDHCPTSQCPGAQCAGSAGFGPNIVVVENLATRSVSRITTKPGSGMSTVTFSPNGRRFAMWLSGAIVLMPTTDPNLQTAVRLAPQRGCVYAQPAWTTRGIFAGESCSAGPSPAMPSRLVLLDTAASNPAKANTSLPLERCINGFHLAVTPARDTVLITRDVGYGDGACAGDVVTHVDILRDGQFAALLKSAGGAPEIGAVA